MRTAVITLTSGRHENLINQRAGLAGGSEPPQDYVVVAMADMDIDGVLADGQPAAHVIHVPTTPTGLPLARARNIGAAAALARHAELLVFLDVDCIPGAGLVRRYRQAAAGSSLALLCGPVAYLPPPPSTGYGPQDLARLADPHRARPAPADGQAIDSHDHELFWSLSFAVTEPVWHVIGGFCEDYTGYGGEDTDFGQLARAAGIGLRWIGGATAFHQHHPVSDPPVEHLDAILRNAAIFHRRWGWWPMTGWLTEFERRGLVRFVAERDAWVATSAEPLSRSR